MQSLSLSAISFKCLCVLIFAGLKSRSTQLGYVGSLLYLLLEVIEVFFIVFRCDVPLGTFLVVVFFDAIALQTGMFFSQRHIHNYTHTYIYLQYTLYIYGTFVVSLLSSDHHLLEDVLRKQRFRMVPEGCKARGGTLHCCPTTAHICPSTYVCTWKYDENPR